MYILSLILWTPVAGALAILAIPAQQIRSIRIAALVSSAVVLILTVWLLVHFDTSSSAIQFAESLPWNAELGSYYALGVDGFSLPMVLHVGADDSG